MGTRDELHIPGPVLAAGCGVPGESRLHYWQACVDDLQRVIELRQD